MEIRSRLWHRLIFSVVIALGLLVPAMVHAEADVVGGCGYARTPYEPDPGVCVYAYTNSNGVYQTYNAFAVNDKWEWVKLNVQIRNRRGVKKCGWPYGWKHASIGSFWNYRNCSPVRPRVRIKGGFDHKKTGNQYYTRWHVFVG